MITEKQISWPGWETVRLIGRGSFGAVYEIQRKVFDDTEKAALKLISIPQNGGDIEEMYSDGYDEESITSTFQSHLKSIVAEYSLMRKMNDCVNIVNCDDVRYVQHDDGIGWDIFIKMELLTPLTKALPADISEGMVVKLGIDMCQALVMCNKYGIIHRDIKPQNIFVSDNGDYKLGDFGIAKTVEKTMGGTKIGTYKYMAPEVYNNQPYGSSADIYSLGLVLYWMLNERRMPFLPLPPEKLKAGMEDSARGRRLSGETIPAPAHGSKRLQEIVLKACAYDPKERYQSAKEMLEELKGLEHNENSAPIPDTSIVFGSVFDENIMGLFFGTQENVEKGSNEKEKCLEIVNEGVSESEEKKGAVGISMNQKMENFTSDENLVSERETASTADNTIAHADNWKEKGIILGLIALILLWVLFFKSCSGGEQSGEESTSEPTRGAVWQPADQETDAIGPKETKEVPTAGVTEAPTEAVTQSSTTEALPPQQLEWSAWMDKLPDYVVDEYYHIEEIVLYSNRKLETTLSTTQSQMSGWELYQTVNGNGDFGAWSQWSASAVSGSNTRDVQTEVRYRYRNKENATSSSSTKSGWNLYDATYSWSDYGVWSDWSTTAVSGSDSRKVETKTQYRYRDKWYEQVYSNWSSWGAWQDSQESVGDLKKEESRTVWAYYYFACSQCGAHSPYHGYTCNSCGKIKVAESSWHVIYSPISWDNAGLKAWDNQKYYTYLDGELVFKWSSGGSKTQYRYATRTLSDELCYSSWSAYSDAVYTASSSREVQTRALYRYCDRQQIASYHFWRWGAWSDWSTDAVSANDSRDVESATYYRYRDRVNVTTYYFRRWTDWSGYSETPISATDTVEVRTKAQYRFKAK